MARGVARLVPTRLGLAEWKRDAPKPGEGIGPTLASGSATVRVVSLGVGVSLAADVRRAGMEHYVA